MGHFDIDKELYSWISNPVYNQLFFLSVEGMKIIYKTKFDRWKKKETFKTPQQRITSSSQKNSNI